MKNRCRLPKAMARRPRVALCGLAWVALGLRLPGLFANTFAADEALFATWARWIAVWRDPLLRFQPVDKPPLLFYGQALFYPLFGPVTWAARMPDLLVSVLLVPLVGVLAWRLYRCEKTAVLAAVFVTFSPLAVQFSATAFIDPLLVFWLAAAVVQTTRNPALSGLLFGLALATKYQAVLFAPLLIGLAWYLGWHWRQWRAWLYGCLPVLAALLVWDVIRTDTFSLWTTQMQSYGGLRLIWSWELWPRALAWIEMGRWLWGSWWLLGMFVVGSITMWMQQNSPNRDIDALLSLFFLSYLLLHWLLAIPVWDRYLLPLLPVVAILTARAVDAVSWKWRAFSLSSLGTMALLLLLLPSGWQAMYGRFPVGGQRDADQGAAQIAAYLVDAPYGTVLYDHWWSWQWRYYLFDKRVFVNWVPHPAALVDDLQVFGRDGHLRYLALPDTAAAQPFYDAVTAAGFPLQLVAAADDMQLYEITP